MEPVKVLRIAGTRKSGLILMAQFIWQFFPIDVFELLFNKVLK